MLRAQYQAFKRQDKGIQCRERRVVKMQALGKVIKGFE